MKSKTSIQPEGKQKTLDQFMQFYELCSLLFDRKRDEIYNVSDIPAKDKFLKVAKDKAKELNISWRNMTHEDSNRIMLAMLEDSFNQIRDIEDSKSMILEVKLIVTK